jgi:hypothetical protein
MASLFRRGTSQSEKSARQDLKEVFISKYELEWEPLKCWLDHRFRSYGCSFTQRFSVVSIPNTWPWYG